MNQTDTIADALANTSKKDMVVISKIAVRAVELARGMGVNSLEALDLSMDLIVANRSNPMNLHRLFEADAPNFVHDVFGIRNHLDRNSGDLLDCFSPRFSKRV